MPNKQTSGYLHARFEGIVRSIRVTERKKIGMRRNTSRSLLSICHRPTSSSLSNSHYCACGLYGGIKAGCEHEFFSCATWTRRIEFFCLSFVPLCLILGWGIHQKLDKVVDGKGSYLLGMSEGWGRDTRTKDHGWHVQPLLSCFHYFCLKHPSHIWKLFVHAHMNACWCSSCTLPLW
jgi:hypothetical protein